jgi:hypothetical protein
VRALLVTLAVGAVASAVLAGSAPAYHFDGVPWPGGVVPYTSEAPDQAWAIAQAVDAWNASGAHVRFVAVPRSQAKLVIREEADKVYCSEGHATVGYGRGAEVVIFPAHGLTHACNPYWAARVMTHELGHVLGLRHEDGVCATMNAYGTMQGGSRCTLERWAWRCRLLELDDVTGVAKIYGGTPFPVKANPYCPLYAAIAAPGRGAAQLSPDGTRLTLSFTRPAPPAIPAFVVPVPWHRTDGFAVSKRRPTCAGAASRAPTPADPWYGWNAKAGARQRIDVSAAAPGCVAVWSLDKLGRSSARPALFRIPGR